MSKYIKYEGKLYRAVDIVGAKGEVSQAVIGKTRGFAISQEKKVGDLVRKAISAVKGGSSWLQTSLVARKYVGEAVAIAEVAYSKIENAIGKKNLYSEELKDIERIHGRLAHFVNVSSVFDIDYLAKWVDEKDSRAVKEAKNAALKQLESSVRTFSK